MDTYFDRLQQDQINLLYKIQEDIYIKLLEILASDENITLIGGTPLSRCYLNHRVSFDLDFAVSQNNDLIKTYLQDIINQKKIKLNNYIIGKEGFYDKAFFRATSNGITVEFSLIQDRKYSNFEYKKMGDITVKTVSLDTLYYNKLQTIAGDFRNFNRNKIRDIFDIVALSKDYIKLDKFIDKIINNIDNTFSEDTFYESLISFD